MKKINWKEVFKNKTTAMALIAAIVSLIYYTLNLFGIVPGIGEEAVLKWFGMVVGILVMLGVVTNSNTDGFGK